MGRGDVVSSLVESLRTGSGASLHGAMGVGKTMLIRWMLAREASDTTEVRWLQGTPGTRAIPFGTAAAALARSGGGGDGADEADVAARLRSALSRPDVVCVLDDLHWVDDHSVGVVQQLLSSQRPPLVLATVRDGERLSPAAVGLLRGPGLERLHLGALDDAAIAELVTQLLGGPADAALLRTVAEVTQGNPLYVNELVASALADGTLVEEHGLWRARGPLSPSVILGDIVASRFDGLSDRAQRSAELLAVAEGLDLDVADRACGAEPLDELDRAGLLNEVTGPGGTLVELAHPIYSEVITRNMGRLTARSHRRALAAAVIEHHSDRRRAGPDTDGPSAMDSHDALRVARWLIAAGDDPDPDLALAAAQQAHSTYDLVTAEMLAQLAWNARPTPASGNLLAEILHGQVRFEEARAVVARLADSAADDRERATITALDAVGRFHGQRDLDGALDLVLTARSRLADTAARQALHVAEVYLLLMAERFDRLDDAISALEADFAPSSTPAMRQLVAGAHIVRGRTAEALELLDRPILTDEDLFVRSEDFTAMADGLRALALTRSGRLHRAEAIGRATHPRCLDLGAPRARAAASYGLAMGLLLQGDPEAALHWAADAAVAQEGVLAPNGLMMAHALGLEAAMALGDGDRAVAERAALSELADTHERLYAAIGWRAEGTARVVMDGDQAGGVGLLLVRAEDYCRIGSPDYAGDLAFRAVTLGGDPVAAAAVFEAAGDSNAPLGALRRRMVEAIVADDPDELEAVGTALHELGCRVDARFGFERAAGAAARRGATRRAAELHQRAAALEGPPVRRDPSVPRDGASPSDEVTRTASPGSGPTPAPVEAQDPLDPERWALLTPREEEVTRLAAQGMQSKAIAATLHLSRRTVDHALQRAYPKLGVSGRSELAGRVPPQPAPRSDQPKGPTP